MHPLLLAMTVTMMLTMVVHHVVFFLGLILVSAFFMQSSFGLAHLMHHPYHVDSQRYTALYTHEATVNRSVFDDLVKQAGDYGKDLVHLNTTCASSNSTIHNNNM